MKMKLRLAPSSFFLIFLGLAISVVKGISYCRPGEFCNNGTVGVGLAPNCFRIGCRFLCKELDPNKTGKVELQTIRDNYNRCRGVHSKCSFKAYVKRIVRDRRSCPAEEDESPTIKAEKRNATKIVMAEEIASYKKMVTATGLPVQIKDDEFFGWWGKICYLLDPECPPQ